jgi:hypothetical protein
MKDDWRVAGATQYSTAVVLRGTAGGDMEIVAKCYAIEGCSDDAVARLVVAAPAMLAVLRMFTELWSRDTCSFYNGCNAAANAAIAKAEGRTA